MQEELPPPWQHQVEAVERAKGVCSFALFMEPGTGKTRTAIDILRYKYGMHKRVLRTIILCPPIVVKQWASEIDRFSKIPRSFVHTLVGPGKKRAQKIVENCRQDQSAIFITNYEALLMEDVFKLFFTWAPEAIVLDESHRCKEPSAKRTKQAMALSSLARYRYILTGTPILNTPMDLFAQYKIMDGGATFGRNFYEFRAKYFIDKNANMPKAKHFPKWVVRPGAYDLMNAKVRATASVVKKSECLTLPPLVRKTVAVELSKTQRKAYDEMRTDLITIIKGEACVATIAAVKALKLLEIVSGYAGVESKDKDGAREIKALRLKDNPRAEALKELLEEITPSAKVLVWAVFRENYQTIREVCDALEVGYVELHGEISAKAKDEAVARLADDPTVRVCIGHPGSGGIGVNLVAASYAITYSRTAKLEHHLQAEARNYRGGSEIHESITHIDLVAEGTIDARVSKLLADKVEISDKVLLDLVEEEA